MTKINVAKQKVTKGSGQKSTVWYLIGAVVVLVLLFAGLKLYNTYPEASLNDIKGLAATYNTELKGFEAQLVEAYQLGIENKDLDSWKAFSQEWISKIGISKPNEFGRRLSNKSMEIVNAANFVSRDLFQLWTEYNVALEAGTPIDAAKEKELLDSIHTGQNFIDKNTLK
jgi:hypothetical protein